MKKISNLESDKQIDLNDLYSEKDMEISLFDEKGNVISCNEFAAEHWGNLSENLIGKNVTEIFSKENGERYLNRIKNVFSSGKPVHFEDKILLNQEERWIYSIYNRISIHNTHYVQIISQDVTSPKKKGEDKELVPKNSSVLERDNKKLSESELKYQTIFDNSADGVIIMSKTKILDCNNQVCKLFGYKKDEIIGKSPIYFSPD